MKFGAILFSVLATSVFNAEAAPARRDTAQYVFQVSNSSAFCSFLPSKPGQEIAANEKTGVPFCTEEGLGGQIFPEGFIQRVNFTKTDSFIQVRANIDDSKYQLQPNDGGGQYDYHDVSGQCEGYPYFVNLVEPDMQDLCIRCCQNKEDCNINVSAYGCNRIIPEVDSSGTPISSVGSAPSSTAAAASSSAASSTDAASSPAPTDDGSTDDSGDSSDGSDSSADDSGDTTDTSDSTDDSGDDTDSSESTDSTGDTAEPSDSTNDTGDITEDPTTTEASA